MSQGHQTLADRLAQALIEGGTWMSRDELRAGQDCSEVALEDALADLVVAGTVTWRENVGYRLAGTFACRRAAQLMRRAGKRMAMVGVPSNGMYLAGIAEQREGLGLVMYELALPMPEPGPAALDEHLAQVGRLVEFVNSRGVADGEPNSGDRAADAARAGAAAPA